MKIDTNDWVSLTEACATVGVSQSTGYRTAKRLGIVQKFFGVYVVKKADAKKIAEGRLPVGNPDWINSGNDAAQAAIRAVESRMKRIAANGMTPAEKRRGARLAKAAKERAGG